MDGLPSWFIRLSAPILAKPLAHLFNLALNDAFFPSQWRAAIITPIPKITNPINHSDFRPISITPVLSRVLEKLVVGTYIYPALANPPSPLNFDDQYAFRPTGSTCSAIIHLLAVITEMLRNNSYVRVVALDFSKAFDTVRHQTLATKLACLKIPDNIYNWLISFLEDRMHCTKLSGVQSSFLSISASVIQGSAMGPSAYAVMASDLHTINRGNCLIKFADDTYLLVPESLSNTCQAEISHIEQWSANNNLTLNRKKTFEILFHSPHNAIKSRLPIDIPPAPSNVFRSFEYFPTLSAREVNKVK